MKLREIKVLRGPNFWSIKKQKLIQMTLDLEELEFRPTNEIPGFPEQLQQLLPSLYNHECSEGHPGGFFERVQDGTWMGHVIEHIALELQTLAGIEVGFGRTRGTGEEGVYHVSFSYGEEKEGIYAGKAAIALVEAIIAGRPFDVQDTIRQIRQLWYEEKLGPTTAALVEEACRRNIPAIRLDGGSLVQLGYGCRQKRVEAALTSHTSCIGVDIAGNKEQTKKILTASNIPVPRGEVVSDVENLEAVVQAFGFPLVVKPLDGNHGNGATIGVSSREEAIEAFARAKKYSQDVIVEQCITGKDYRVLVVNNRFVAAALRTPAHVIGDGHRTIRELIDEVNEDPRRGACHENMLTAITVDAFTMDLLAKKGYTLDTVLRPCEVCFLKPTANLSTGGTATDVTDEVHPSNVKLFERIARTIGLDVCGIDIMAKELSTPIRENGGAVIEVNAAPGLRMHLEPTHGQPRNVAAPIIDMLFSGNGRIPIVAITGTNGKTTTTRLMAHMAAQSGCVTGYTTTDGVYIDSELVLSGDCSGPSSAQMILRDPTVQFAVLECARGGMLRSGLGFDQCDCAIVTNVAEDHLGIGGIDTIEQLAKVKSIVPESVSAGGYAVLNADDDLVYAMKDKVKCKVALYSLYPDSARIEDHCSKGGIAAIYENGFLLLRIGNHIIPIEEAVNVPITFGGKAEFNIANVLAASLAAYTNRIKLSTIRQSLRTFVPSAETTPGRVNIFEFNNFTILVDYAHNPHAMKNLGRFIKSFEHPRKVGIVTGVGDRRDEDIVAMGEEAARIFDEVIIRHDEDMRGRTVEEVEALLSKGIKRVDPKKPLSYSEHECDAIHFAVGRAERHSLIVVFIEDVERVLSCIQQLQQHERETGLMSRTG